MKYLFLLFLMAACTKNAADSSDTFRIPWADANQNYSLQDVKIESFTQPEYLRGTFAEFYVEPGLDFEQGRITQPGTPNGRFVSTPSGSMLALNTASLEAATIYAHLERLQKLNSISGADQYADKHLSVGVEVNIETEDNQTIDNNAEYNPDVDSLLFMPYTSSGLPIPYNAGVIGHEYFHSIFQHLVIAGLTSHNDASFFAARLAEPNTMPDPQGFTPSVNLNSISMADYNRFLVRGINEGLADFWGWIYSGDDNFVARSIVAAKSSRKLSRDDIQFYTVDSFQKNLSFAKDDNYRLALSYSLGSQYAVYLHNLMLSSFGGKSDSDTRAQMAKILVQALLKFRADNLQVQLDSTYLAPEIFVKSFVAATQESSSPTTSDAVDFCASFRKVAPNASASSVPAKCVVSK